MGDSLPRSTPGTAGTAGYTDAPPMHAAQQHSLPARLVHSTGFNLAEIVRSDWAVEPTADPSAAPPSSLEAKVDQLFTLVSQLQRDFQVRPAPSHCQPGVVATELTDAAAPADVLASGGLPVPLGSSWTLPPSGNATVLPPLEVRELRCSSFQEPRTRIKGEYCPPPVHQLAAHRMFRDLNSEPGAWLSPMSYVLHLRELECIRFDVSPAVLMTLHSGHLGSRGLTVLHFRPLSELEHLERGSSNANFASDFGSAATLPPTDVSCSTYEDLLLAIGGLISVGDALWYDYARRLLSRIKRFILANMERDANTPERVRLTLLFVNQFLGRALAQLLVDSPHWWRSFCDAVRAVDYHHADWQAALNELALRLVAAPASAPTASAPGAPQRRLDGPPRRGPATRTPVMPDAIRRLIPRDRDDREPCLRFLAGGMCYGGSPERCAHHNRTHRWRGHLPRELQDFVDRHYRPDRRPTSRRDRF